MEVEQEKGSSENEGDERWDGLEVPALGWGILVSGTASQVTALMQSPFLYWSHGLSDRKPWKYGLGYPSLFIRASLLCAEPLNCMLTAFSGSLGWKSCKEPSFTRICSGCRGLIHFKRLKNMIPHPDEWMKQGVDL